MRSPSGRDVVVRAPAAWSSWSPHQAASAERSGVVTATGAPYRVADRTRRKAQRHPHLRAENVVSFVIVSLLVIGVVAIGRRRGRDAGPSAGSAPRDLVRRALAVVSDMPPEQLQRVVERLLRSDPRVDVVVVASAAPSAPALTRPAPRITVLRRLDCLHEGSALQIGATHGLAHDYDAIIAITPRHDRLARRIPALLDALDDGAHVAVGSRFVPGGRVISGRRPQRWCHAIGNAAVRAVAGLPVADVAGHLWAYRRSAVTLGVLQAVGLGAVHTLDALLRCHHAGLTIREVPVTVTGPMTDRPMGYAALLVRALAWRRAPARQAATGFGDRLVDITDVRSPRPSRTAEQATHDHAAATQRSSARLVDDRAVPAAR